MAEILGFVLGLLWGLVVLAGRLLIWGVPVLLRVLWALTVLLAAAAVRGFEAGRRYQAQWRLKRTGRPARLIMAAPREKPAAPGARRKVRLSGPNQSPRTEEPRILH